MAGAQIIQRKGHAFHATVPGQKHPIVIGRGTLVPIDTKTQYDRGDGSPMESLHAAYHGGRLPKALVALIEQAIEEAMAKQHADEAAKPHLPGAPAKPTLAKPPAMPVGAVIASAAPPKPAMRPPMGGMPMSGPPPMLPGSGR